MMMNTMQAKSAR